MSAPPPLTTRPRHLWNALRSNGRSRRFCLRYLIAVRGSVTG